MTLTQGVYACVGENSEGSSRQEVLLTVFCKSYIVIILSVSTKRSSYFWPHDNDDNYHQTSQAWALKGDADDDDDENDDDYDYDDFQTSQEWALR